MPNWNSNNLSIKGNVLQVLQFIEDNFDNVIVNEKKNEYGYVLDFEVFAPTPKDENGEIIDSWYEWRTKEWGCKWSPLVKQLINLSIYNEDESEYMFLANNDEDDEFNQKTLTELFDKEEIEDMNAELLVYFDTPWCPPTGMFIKWIKKYKELDIRLTFYEPGWCFAGVFDNEGAEFNEVYYGSDDEVSYIEFLLNEGFEELDYYKEDLEYTLNEINKNSDREFATRLVEKVCQTLDELKDNFSRAVLIADIRKQLSNIDSEEDK